MEKHHDNKNICLHNVLPFNSCFDVNKHNSKVYYLEGAFLPRKYSYDDAIYFAVEAAAKSKCKKELAEKPLQIPGGITSDSSVTLTHRSPQSKCNNC